MEIKSLERLINLQRFLGFWPLDEKCSWYLYLLHKTVHFLGVAILIYSILTLFLKIAMDFEDLDNIATVIDCGTLYAADLFRLIGFYFRGVEYVDLVKGIFLTFTNDSLNPGPKKTTMDKYRTIALVFCSSYVSGGVIFTMHVIGDSMSGRQVWNNNTEMPFLFEMWLPMDLHSEPNRSIQIAIQLISWLYCTFSFLIISAFWFAVMILTIGQFCLITDSINQMAADLRGRDDIPDEYRRSFLKCLKQHQLIRRFVIKIESLLSYIVLIDFLHAMISITFILLDMVVSMKHGNWVAFSSMLEYFCLSVIHMFFLDFLGNELQLREEVLGKALYTLPWYNDMKSQAPLITITTAATRQPNRLTGGKFYNLTNEFFVGAMRTIFSFFMVLQQLHDESE